MILDIPKDPKSKNNGKYYPNCINSVYFFSNFKHPLCQIISHIKPDSAKNVWNKYNQQRILSKSLANFQIEKMVNCSLRTTSWTLKPS